MRTSYERNYVNKRQPATRERVNSQNPTSAKEESFSYDENQAVRELIVSGYSQVRDELDAKNPQNDEEKVSTPKKEKQVKKDKEKKSGHALIFIIIGILVAVIIVSGVLVWKGIIELPFKAEEPTQPTEEVYIPQLDYIKEDISKLYVDGEILDVTENLTTADLDIYYNRLNDAANNGEDTGEVVAELDTIADYLYDRSKLELYENEEYDLSPDLFLEDVLKLKASADNYTVIGLKEDIYERTDSLLAMREEFLRIKSTLLGVSDLLTFDSGSYLESISKITHAVNAEELRLLLVKVSADSEVVKAEAAIETAEDKEAATQYLEDAKIARDEATKALEIFNGTWVEPTEPINETSEVN